MLLQSRDQEKSLEVSKQVSFFFFNESRKTGPLLLDVFRVP